MKMQKKTQWEDEKHENQTKNTRNTQTRKKQKHAVKSNGDKPAHKHKPAHAHYGHIVWPIHTNHAHTHNRTNRERNHGNAEQAAGNQRNTPGALKRRGWGPRRERKENKGKREGENKGRETQEEGEYWENKQTNNATIAKTLCRKENPSKDASKEGGVRGNGRRGKGT